MLATAASPLATLKALQAQIQAQRAAIQEKYQASDIPALEGQIKALQDQIDGIKRDSGIYADEGHLADMEQEFMGAVEVTGQALPVEAWQPDRFSKGKYDAYKADGVALLRKSKTRRIIDAPRLIKAYPGLTDDIVKITLTDAEGVLSKRALEPFMTKITSYTYEVSE